MPNAAVGNNPGRYDLPECSFTAPYGYEFDYWTADCEIDENTELPVHKQPNQYFSAPYIYNESDVQTITVTAYWKEKAKYSVTLPDNMELVSGIVDNEGKAYKDEVITFKAVDGCTLFGDVKVGDTVLTPDENGIYTVTVTDDTTITADIVAYTPVVINSVDINGITTPTTVYKEIYASADYPVPANQYIDGYTFKGWKVNDVLKETEAEVQSAVETLVKSETPVTVKVVYEKNNITYKVNVDVGGAFSDGSSEERAFHVSDIVTVIANRESPEQAFTCRKRGEKIVSYEKTYSFFMPNEDITLTAIYEGGTEQKGIAFIEKVDSDKDNGEMVFVSVCNVPKSCKMKNAGLIADLNKDNLSAFNTARFKKLSDKVTENTKELKYTWTVGGANDNTVLYVRSYLVYEDANGETHELFGDVVKASLDSWTIIKDEVTD